MGNLVTMLGGVVAAAARRREVGAYCWGLVDGRTQTRFPWTSWVRPVRGSRPWFHDLLRRDGSPYDPGEAALLRRAARHP